MSAHTHCASDPRVGRVGVSCCGELCLGLCVPCHPLVRAISGGEIKYPPSLWLSAYTADCAGDLCPALLSRCCPMLVQSGLLFYLAAVTTGIIGQAKPTLTLFPPKSLTRPSRTFPAFLAPPPQRLLSRQKATDGCSWYGFLFLTREIFRFCFCLRFLGVVLHAACKQNRKNNEQF